LYFHPQIFTTTVPATSTKNNNIKPAKYPIPMPGPWVL
jgi:hypothetical protein